MSDPARVSFFARGYPTRGGGGAEAACEFACLVRPLLGYRWGEIMVATPPPIPTRSQPKLAVRCRKLAGAA